MSVVAKKLFGCLIAASAIATSITYAFADSSRTATVPEPYEPGNSAVQSWNIHKISKAECSNKQQTDKQKLHPKEEKHQS